MFFGGFAALGNPASFHNPLVRNLRIKAHDALVKYILKPLISSRTDSNQRNKMKLEMLFDRMMYRMKSQAACAEAWHRDVMPKNYIEREDEVLGGWINLDSDNQYFSYIPGSHLEVIQRELEEGFADIDKEKVKRVSEFKTRITIPPGHLVVFPQYILHEVVATPAAHDMFRLFTGWRLTMSDAMLRPGITEDIENQAVMKIPGGMVPPMYSANHASNFLHKPFKPVKGINNKVSTIEWANNTMSPQTLEDKVGKSGVNKGIKYRIVPRWMKSLKEYGFKLYPVYSKQEQGYYRPHKI